MATPRHRVGETGWRGFLWQSIIEHLVLAPHGMWSCVRLVLPLYVSGGRYRQKLTWSRSREVFFLVKACIWSTMCYERTSAQTEVVSVERTLNFGA